MCVKYASVWTGGNLWMREIGKVKRARENPEEYTQDYYHSLWWSKLPPLYIILAIMYV